MAKVLRYLGLFAATTLLATVFLLVSPSGANPGTAASSGSSPAPLGETVTNLVNGVLDLLGLRGPQGASAPPTVSEGGCATSRFSTASGECSQGATQAFSTSGVTAPAGVEAAPAVQAAAPARLAFTGPSTAWLGAVAALFVLLGMALVLAARPVRATSASR